VGERFGVIVELLHDEPGVTYGNQDAKQANRFGSNGLKTQGKVFAFLSGGKLVLKLPRERVDGLIAKGQAERFDPRHDGRIMKEWLTVAADSPADWLQLAREAMAFVGGLS
jgi:hypothetical protein